MTDNNINKFIPKLPETETKIVLNQEQQTPQEQKPITEKAVDTIKNIPETIIPVAHASDKDEGKEGAKQVVGTELAVTDAIAPPAGIIASGVSAIGGSLVEGIGKATGNEDMKDVGEIYKEAPVQPAKEVGKAVKKATE